MRFTGSALISVFAYLIVILGGIVSSAITIKIYVITAGMKKLLKLIIKKIKRNMI